VYSRTAAATNAVTNLDALDENRKLSYNSYQLEFRARPFGAAQIFGGFAFERQINVNCAAQDNPNNLRFCDDSQNDIPFRKQFKLAGSYPLPYGVQFSASFQSTPGPPGDFGFTTANLASTSYMTITRGTSTYPSNCPAPCPAGAVILPASFIGTPTAPQTLLVALTPANAYFIERINQLDIKLQKNFTVRRFTISPSLEIFNINNSDAIISTVTNNALSSSYRYANSIMQPRLIGFGAQVRW
jgi:hypothetical protein